MEEESTAIPPWTRPISSEDGGRDLKPEKANASENWKRQFLENSEKVLF